MNGTTFPTSLLTTCKGEPFPERGLHSDDDLVQAARAGAPWALELLTSRYRERIYAYARGMLRHHEDAEDVTQETFVQAFGALGSYRLRGCFRAWLFRIAGNQCRDRRRREHSRTVPLTSLEWERAADPNGDPNESVPLRMAVQCAVARLPEHYRGPVLLHYMEGLTVAETAWVLGRTQTAVRVQLWRARHQLAVTLSHLRKEETR